MDLNLRCSIVVGLSRIEVCLLKKKGKNYKVESLAFYEFEDEKEIDGIVNNISEHLPKDVLTNVSFKHSSIIEHIYFYSLKTDVRSNVYKDLKRDYEIELKDYIIDYEDNEFADRKIVYVVAMPKTVFDFYYKVLSSQKKLKLYSFETHGSSLKRAVNEFEGGGYILECPIFEDYSSILVCGDGKFLAQRNLRYSWRDLVNSLATPDSITDEEVEKLLEEKGLEEPSSEDQNDQPVYQNISNAFDQFTIEIQRTIDYLTTVQKMGRVERIITIGKINRINKIDRYISRLFSLETVKFQPQKLVEFGDDIDFSIVGNMNYFEVCIGAALKEVQ